MSPRPRQQDLDVCPESDRAGELPHPRDQLTLFGHHQSCAVLASAAKSGQMHHAWLFTGPKGVGKATLAWRFARALLAYGPNNCPNDLSVPEDHLIARQLSALTHPDVILLRRPWEGDKKKFKSELPIDEVRKLRGFFSRHATYGGAHIAIVDCTDDLSLSAQNALLKTLEEPPKNALLLLIANAPGALLPTIRSRCRTLALRKLDNTDMQQALSTMNAGMSQADREIAMSLANGAPGRALSLASSGGITMYRDILDILDQIPRLDPVMAFSFAERVAKLPHDSGVGLFCGLISQAEERLVRHAFAQGPLAAFESKVFDKLRSLIRIQSWAQHWEEMRGQFRRADELNLDKKQLILNTFFSIESLVERTS